MKFVFIIILLFSRIYNSYAVQTPKSPHLKTSSEFPNLFLVNHPLLKQKLTSLRNKKTESAVFRTLLEEISIILAYEVTRHIETVDVEVETPLMKTIGGKLKHEVVIIPILRSGLGMIGGLQKLVPTADIGHIGVFRDHKTNNVIEYLFKVPNINNQLFIVVDPMIATANSAIYVVKKLINLGVPESNIIFMALVVTPEGLKNFQKEFSLIPIYAAALDEKLNENAYILPGLGDAGDRLYGTE